MVNCWKSLWVYGIALIIFFIYRGYLRTLEGSIEINDLLNHNYYICPLSGEMSSLWPVTHFLLYAILGFLFPTCFLFLMIIGFVWEGIENIFGYFQTKSNQPTLQNVEYQVWWGGSLKDITYNLAGYLVGASLAVGTRGVNPYEVECLGILARL